MNHATKNAATTKILAFALTILILIGTIFTIFPAIPVSAMDFVKPVASYLNSGGYFKWLTYTSGTYHVGINIPASAGDPVYAIRDGIVRIAKEDRAGYGQLNPSKPSPVISIEHKDDNKPCGYAAIKQLTQKMQKNYKKYKKGLTKAKICGRI